MPHPLAERDPLDVITAKAGLDAAFTTIAALAAGEPAPTASAIAVFAAYGVPDADIAALV